MACVLVVEDEPALRSVVEQSLTRCGYSVVTATDGFDALEKLSQGSVDLVITDMVMPEMDGVKLIGHIRKSYPHIKVIAMSGGGTRFGPEDCLDLAVKNGANRTLMKPFMLRELFSMAEELLGTSPA